MAEGDVAEGDVDVGDVAERVEGKWNFISKKKKMSQPKEDQDEEHGPQDLQHEVREEAQPGSIFPILLSFIFRKNFFPIKRMIKMKSMDPKFLAK